MKNKSVIIGVAFILVGLLAIRNSVLASPLEWWRDMVVSGFNGRSADTFTISATMDTAFPLYEYRTAYYKVDNQLVYQLIENAVKEMTESVTLDYSKLYTAYDTIKKDHDDTKKRFARTLEENKAFSTRNYELKNRNDELLLALKSLEGMSDESLKAKLQEWIVEHNGEINVNEFSRTHKVGEGRVEDMLNRLVSEGYLEVMR